MPMVLSKYDLPNECTIIWLGEGKVWGKGDGSNINNVLILATGEVLVLKTVYTFDLSKKAVKKDILNLHFEEFICKYGLPNNEELWAELKQRVESGKYGPCDDL
jgi:hypothetical protein